MYNEEDDNFNDNFEDFVISTDVPDIYHNDDYDYFREDIIPTINARDFSQTIQ